MKQLKNDCRIMIIEFIIRKIDVNFISSEFLIISHIIPCDLKVLVNSNSNELAMIAFFKTSFILTLPEILKRIIFKYQI